jgi:phosphoribosylglycinamide formyltransferase-1
MKLLIIGNENPTLFKSIIDAVRNDELPVQLVGLISSVGQNEMIDLAQDQGIPTEFVSIPSVKNSAGYYDKTLCDRAKQYQPDLIFLIGYTRILSAEFVAAWPGKIINIHGSLLPKYAGLMREHTQAAVLANGDKEAGCTVHIVTEKVDAGPNVAQGVVPVLEGDTPTILRCRIRDIAGDVCVEAVRIMQRSFQLDGKFAA